LSGPPTPTASSRRSIEGIKRWRPTTRSRRGRPDARPFRGLEPLEPYGNSETGPPSGSRAREPLQPLRQPTSSCGRISRPPPHAWQYEALRSNHKANSGSAPMTAASSPSDGVSHPNSRPLPPAVLALGSAENVSQHQRRTPPINWFKVLSPFKNSSPRWGPDRRRLGPHRAMILSA
jgi:hypothetical protein